MTAEGMTSVSVSYEIRSQLNTMQATSGHRSVNDLFEDMIRTYKILKLHGEIDMLQGRIKEHLDIDVHHLAERLNLSPFKV